MVIKLQTTSRHGQRTRQLQAGENVYMHIASQANEGLPYQGARVIRVEKPTDDTSPDPFVIRFYRIGDFDGHQPEPILVKNKERTRLIGPEINETDIWGKGYQLHDIANGTVHKLSYESATQTQDMNPGRRK